MHEECLTDSMRAHIWNGGKKFKCGRLSNISNTVWKAFKERCEQAANQLEKQKKRGGRLTKDGIKAGSKKKIITLTESTRARPKKKARKN